MKYFMLLIGLFLSLNATAKNNNCDIAKEAFRDSASLMSDVVLFGMDTNGKPGEYNYYHTWYKNYYPKKIGSIKDRYDAYTKKVDSNNPIYLGITSIIQANNIAKAMDLYLEDNSNKDKLKEAHSLYNSMYQQLVKDCGKI